MSAYYFAYGSNMNRLRVETRGMSFTNVQGGVLMDYALRFNKRSVKLPGAASANVVAAPDSKVEGVLYALPREDDIFAMDPFEGYPVRYDRQLMPIVCEGGTCSAWVYTANDDYVQEGLKPARWYLNHLLAGSGYLSPLYLSVLRGIACLPDSDVEPT
ncbi:MAG: gamma-glutamylcyclotransferase family protein [Pseudomonadota bacterium]